MLLQTLALQVASGAGEAAFGALRHTVDIIAAKPNSKGIADEIADVVAPIAALLIGIFGLRFLFGQDKSFGAFLSFIILGILVFVFIKFGNDVIMPLAEWVRDLLVKNT